jgi:hypothetical protein
LVTVAVACTEPDGDTLDRSSVRPVTENVV